MLKSQGPLGLSILCCHGNHYAKFWLTNLKDTLMLHARKRFELHTFSSFREIKTNNFLPRITDQQLRTNGEFKKLENDSFRVL